ncbi:MAG: hypothetical protein ACPGC9_02135 [Cytophagales bacterium]
MVTTSRNKSFKTTLTLCFVLVCFSLPTVKCTTPTFGPTFAEECRFVTTHHLVGAGLVVGALLVYNWLYYKNRPPIFSLSFVKDFLYLVLSVSVCSLLAVSCLWKFGFATECQPWPLGRSIVYGLVAGVFLSGWVIIRRYLKNPSYNIHYEDDIFWTIIIFGIFGAIGGGVNAVFN